MLAYREFVFIKAAEISEIEQHTAVALSVLFFGITVVSALIGSIVKLDVQRPDGEITKSFRIGVEF